MYPESQTLQAHQKTKHPWQHQAQEVDHSIKNRLWILCKNAVDALKAKTNSTVDFSLTRSNCQNTFLWSKLESSMALWTWDHSRLPRTLVFHGMAAMFALFAGDSFPTPWELLPQMEMWKGNFSAKFSWRRHFSQNKLLLVLRKWYTS